MTPISRRNLWKSGDLFGRGRFSGRQCLKPFSRSLGLPIGSQVWPTRSMIKDFPAYVKMMADIGVTRLELCSPVGYGARIFISRRTEKKSRASSPITA